MGALDSIIRGKQPTPPRIIIHGTEGVGKSTLASNAPNPVFIQTERGLNEIDCAKFPLATSSDDVTTQLLALAEEKHDYQTVVIDSLDWLEQLHWAAVCTKFGVQNIVKADGGYARGYDHALNYFRENIEALDHLNTERGMIVILISHSKVEKFDDPETNAYDRYAPRLQDKAKAMMVEWADAVLFATRKIILKSEDAGFNKTRQIASGLGADGGERILKCIGSPSCVAKNRYNLPAEMSLKWSDLEAGIIAAQQGGKK